MYIEIPTKTVNIGILVAKLPYAKYKEPEGNITHIDEIYKSTLN